MTATDSYRRQNVGALVFFAFALVVGWLALNESFNERMRDRVAELEARMNALDKGFSDVVASEAKTKAELDALRMRIVAWKLNNSTNR